MKLGIGILFICSFFCSFSPSFCALYKIIEVLVGFCRACAPVRCAHPSFSAHCHANRGAARPVPAHRSFAASQKYIKSVKLGPPTSKAFFFPLDHMQRAGAEAMKYEVPCTSPAHRSFADPSGNILGSKLCTVRPYALIFSGFSFFI